MLIEQGKLRAGMRPFASCDHPRVFRPAGEVDEVGQLDHPRAITSAAIALNRGDPVLFLGQKQAVADSLIDRKPA